MNYCINLILLFFTAAFLGWCMEVTGKYFVYHRFINRGMLTGPCLPIYGAGACIVTIIVGLVPGSESSMGTTFFIAFFACGFIEYMASYVMEKKFHARWWDYCTKPMNLNGRIWIGNLILFGIAGVVVCGYINPVLFGWYDAIDIMIREIICGVLVVLFISDYVMSHFVLKLVKVSVEQSEADNTEAISKEVRLILSDRNIFYRRFADAYPDVIYKTERIAQRMEEIRLETEKFREELVQKKDELSAELTEKKDAISAELAEKREAFTSELSEKKEAFSSELAEKKEAITTGFTEKKDALSNSLAEKKDAFSNGVAETKEALAARIKGAGPDEQT